VDNTELSEFKIPEKAPAEVPQLVPTLDFERFPYSGTAEHEEWAKGGGSIVNGERWGWL
jgi:hypothetical protein